MLRTALSRRNLLLSIAAVTAASSVRAWPAVPALLIPPADRELRVPVRGGTIFVRTNGNLKSKAKPLLLVHGGPGGACWQLFPAVPLSSERGIILYDQLDSGHSDAPGSRANWTIERFASEIDAIRAALDLEEFHLLGHSWGGIVATRYASRQPAGLRSLILQGAPLSAATFARSERGLVETLPTDERAIALRSLSGQFVSPTELQATFDVFQKRFFYREQRPRPGFAYMDGTPFDRGDALRKYLTGGPGFRFTGALSTLDDESLLSTICAPTMLMCGEFDIMTPSITRGMLLRLQQGNFVEIAGAGHMIQFDRPDEWREAISTFITRHDR